MEAHFTEMLMLMLMVRILGKLLSEPGIVYLDHWIYLGLMVSSLFWVRRASAPIPVTSPVQVRYA